MLTIPGREGPLEQTYGEREIELRGTGTGGRQIG